LENKHMRWLTKVVATLGFMTVLSHSLFAQCTNIDAPETVTWVNSLINGALGDDTACRSAAPDRDTFAIDHACNIFVGRVLARIYGLPSFTGTGGSFLRANEIAALLPTMNGWVDLGSAGDQNVLDQASAAAGSKHLVIAVWPNPIAGKPGHVVLIGPGPKTKSTSWGSLNVPVAASFRLDDVDSAFLGQPLSCAFSGAKRTATHIWEYTPIVPIP
jgi:hypothetical protein